MTEPRPGRRKWRKALAVLGRLLGCLLFIPLVLLATVGIILDQLVFGPVVWTVRGVAGPPVTALGFCFVRPLIWVLDTLLDLDPPEVPCPHAVVCDTCACADEDDVCFPDEREREERLRSDSCSVSN